MILFDEFKPQGNSPIYQQIVVYIKKQIVAEIILDGDELPSRRLVSTMLGINPNTVQKAYKQLEDEGLIFSKAGASSHMVVSKKKIREIKKELMESNTLEMVNAMKDMGISREEAIDMIIKIWGDVENE